MTGMMLWLANRLYHLLGQRGPFHDGMPQPPGDSLSLNFGEKNTRPGGDGRSLYVASVTNDGFDFFIGNREQWFFHCRAPEARQLAWFILWDWWLKSTWLGLKRKAWYWALHQQCEHDSRMARLVRQESNTQVRKGNERGK